jgi:glycosyltransferase involved in cell wall biosynthesis
VGTIRQRLKLPLGTPLAVYVGLVTFNRGIEQNVDILRHNPALHLALVGPQYDPVAAFARTLAERVGAKDRLHLIDPVPSEDVVSFIADADCSLVTGQNICLSYYLSFPNKLLESVFAGLPIIGSRLKEIVRFIEEFQVGVIADETDSRALASAVQAVIENRTNYRLSSAQQNELAKRYGWRAQKEKLLELYEKLNVQQP